MQLSEEVCGDDPSVTSHTGPVMAPSWDVKFDAVSLHWLSGAKQN